MRVIATATGYDGVCLREPGDEFDMPNGSCDPVPVRDANGRVVQGKFEPETWFKPVKSAKPVEPASEGKPSGKDNSEGKDLV
jgi:hypothetical protein